MLSILQRAWDFICARDRKAEALRDITCDCCPHYYDRHTKDKSDGKHKSDMGCEDCDCWAFWPVGLG